MTAPGSAVGARIRALRTAAGLSLSALAQSAGVGKGTLSELENGTRNPTLDTLYAVAGPLGVPLAALLEDHDGAAASDGALEAVRLHVVTDEESVTEVYLVRVGSGRTRESPAHAVGSRERLVVLTGRCRLDVDGTVHELRAGATTTWAADRPHAYTALGGAEMTAVDVIVTPRRT